MENETGDEQGNAETPDTEVRQNVHGILSMRSAHNPYPIIARNSTSMSRRIQGRPSVGSNQVGRQHIIESMRQMMIRRPKADIQRRHLAEFAGITPSLITYYFPERMDLIIECAKPIIGNYIETIHDILNSDAPRIVVLRGIISLFVTFNYDTGYMLDFYIDIMSKEEQRAEFERFAESYMMIGAFMKRLVDEHGDAKFDSAFLQSSLWGLCKYLAGQPHLHTPDRIPDRDEIITSLADNVFDMFVGGAFPSISKI